MHGYVDRSIDAWMSHGALDVLHAYGALAMSSLCPPWQLSPVATVGDAQHAYGDEEPQYLVCIRDGAEACRG